MAGKRFGEVLVLTIRFVEMIPQAFIVPKVNELVEG
jgi:hypothetical protein